MKTATLIGSTGLIGGHILEILKNDDYFDTIRVLVRRHAFDHPKVDELVINFSDEASFRTGVEGSDAVFCAVGTTNAKVKGDKTAYRKVDHDIPVNAAKFCLETKCPQLLLVSSVGANSKSNNFYLKLKGEVEDEISAMGLPSVSVFRPSMLMGKRNESRPAEEFTKVVISPLSFLFPAKFRPVKGEDVAKAMVNVSKKGEPGFRIYHYSEIRDNVTT